MSDLISKRAVLAKINLWVNGELSTDKLIESIKKMSGGSLTDRPCSVCRFKTKNGCNRWECVFKGVWNDKGRS